MLLMMGAVNIQMVARGYLAWEISHSAISVAFIGAGFAPPILVLSIFGGVVADRLERKKILQISQFGMLLIALAVAFSIKTNTVSIYHLFAASIAQGTIWAFLMPARQAIITQLVEKKQLTNAVALNASGMSLTTLISPAVGGVIYGVFGVEFAYYSIALLAGTAILFTSFIPNIPKLSKSGKKVWVEMKEGISYVNTNKTVMWLIVLAMTTTLLGMPFRTLLPVQIDEIFKAGPEALGLLMSMIGLGALLGSLFIAGMKQTQSRGLTLLITSFISGIAILVNSMVTQYWMALLLMIVLGIGDSGRRTLNSSLLMEHTDDNYRGRVMGIYMMNFGLIPVGVIPLGFVAEFAGVQMAFACAGGLLILSSLAVTLSTDKIRRL